MIHLTFIVLLNIAISGSDPVLCMSRNYTLIKVDKSNDVISCGFESNDSIIFFSVDHIKKQNLKAPTRWPNEHTIPFSDGKHDYRKPLYKNIRDRM